MRWLSFLLLLGLALNGTAARAEGVSLVHLEISPYHAASKIWQGQFTGLNGRAFDTRQFYQSSRPEFSARSIWAKPVNRQLTLLLPISLDGGYKARLMQTKPLLSLGFGAAIGLGAQTMLSMRAENILRLGGQTKEQPCRDAYRRDFHCGSGMAWTDYEKSPIDRRGALNAPGFHARLVHYFSF